MKLEALSKENEVATAKQNSAKLARIQKQEEQLTKRCCRRKIRFGNAYRRTIRYGNASPLYRRTICYGNASPLYICIYSYS